MVAKLSRHNLDILCTKCFEVNKEYIIINNGQKLCYDCGGVVLNTQEAADYIGELQAEVRALEEIYGE